MHYQFHLLATVIAIGVAMGAVLGTCAYLILLERKIAAWLQDRVGPNRVGPWGLLQPIADGLKFFPKEQIVPAHVDRLFYFIAPAIATSTALLAFAVVPFGPTRPAPDVPWPQTVAEEKTAAAYRDELDTYNRTFQFVIAPHVDVGIVYVFAIGSLAVYGIILGGWSSNSKYSMLGSLRSSAQLISYEVPLGLSALAIVLLAGSLNLERIIDHQLRVGWHIWYQPLSFVLFLTSVFAECNRLPFDLPEAEQELVGGYHTEYSGMKFAMFFLGEYTHMITTSFLVVVLFFGGWHFPWIAEPGTTGLGAQVVKVVVIAGKMFCVIVFFMLVRWTIPRFRFDQLMGLAWQVMIPLAIGNLIAVMVVKHAVEVYGIGSGWYWLLLPESLALLLAAGLWAVKGRPPVQGTIVVVRGHQRVEIPAP